MDIIRGKQQYDVPPIKDAFLCRRDVPKPKVTRPRPVISKPKVSQKVGVAATVAALLTVPLFVYDDKKPEKKEIAGGESWNKSPDYTVSKTSDGVSVRGMDGVVRTVQFPCIPYLEAIRNNYFAPR